MEKEKIIRRRLPKKEIVIGIRITKKLSNWLREQNYSPTGIFYESCRDLGFKE